MQLENDLYAIDQTLLVKAGEVIHRSTLKHIASLSGRQAYKPIKDTWLMKDLIQTFQDQRYVNILYPPEISKKVIQAIKRLKIPENIFLELAFMKKKSPYTYHHILIIAIVTAKLSLDRSIRYVFETEMAIILSLFHDLGKSRIPNNILDKKTPLTIQERKILSTHPLIGYILLHYYFGSSHQNFDFSSYQHHERLDGSGYPLGIKRINKYAQLIGVVDTLDALISDRPYRSRPYSLRAAIDFLLDESEKGKFNKRMVRTLIIYSRREAPGAKIVIGEKGRDKVPEKNSYGKTAKS